MAQGTTRITGLREFQRACRKLEVEVGPELKEALLKAAEPVAEGARDRLAAYAGTSLNTIAPRASVRGAYVTQRARKVTGLRADFGALQMRKGMLPSLAEHENEIVKAAEQMLDHVTREAGF